MDINEIPNNSIQCSLSVISSYLDCPIVGKDIVIDGFNLCNRTILANNAISYCTSIDYMLFAIRNDKVKALIVSPELFNQLEDPLKERFSYIISPTPEWSFYRVYMYMIEKGMFSLYNWKTVLENVNISTGAIVEDGVILGKNVSIGSNSVIKSGTIIGDNVVIGACSVIGSEGFQLIKDDKGINHTIPHVGRTYIGNNVSLGDNVTISRSLFEGYTIISDNVKIDNQVHIGHNCYIGKNSVITANSTMFGSSSIGTDVWIAPHCAIMNKVHVGDNAFVCACSFVWRNVKSGTKVGGNPAHRIQE